MFLIWSVGYFLIAARTDMATASTLMSRFERAIPFIPEFVFIYVTIYPMFLLPFFMVRDNEFFKVFSLAYITLMIFCYSIFLIFPVSIERVASYDAPGFTRWALGLVHRFDKPVNCFPSMHCAMAMISALTIYEINRFKGALALGMTFLIGLSTLFTKQHYMADVLAGFGMAAVMYYIYFKQRVINVLTREWQRMEDSLESAIFERIDKRIEKLLDKKIQDRIDELIKERIEKR